ncbi:hypothetical protein KC19_11G155100 [Ceratodon purpureus]|uniref:Uncharacterized protein n=1 Tax=Ceratodon purpureus TaxID=3225 RepID=A0A8T0GHX4_CERPU|nr:hypothetical protein KC19_11G155100 [Ceratodon purpureus]
MDLHSSKFSSTVTGSLSMSRVCLVGGLLCENVSFVVGYNLLGLASPSKQSSNKMFTKNQALNHQQAGTNQTCEASWHQKLRMCIHLILQRCLAKLYKTSSPRNSTSNAPPLKSPPPNSYSTRTTPETWSSNHRKDELMAPSPTVLGLLQKEISFSQTK